MKIKPILGDEYDLQNGSRGFLGGCRSITEFDKLNRLGEGTYGVVHRARDLTNDSIVALKEIRLTPREKRDGIPLTALREISLLRSLRHHNVINVLDIAVGTLLDETHLVLEYAEQDLANLLDVARVKYSLSEAKCLFRQLLQGLEYLHDNRIIHRDIKLSNLLLTTRGVLKIADFGMAREMARMMTPGVVTIWNRSPELLFGANEYGPSVDIWSAGCILGELLIQMPMLPGSNEMEQLDHIARLLGSPNDKIWPGWRSLPNAKHYRGREQRFNTLPKRFGEFGESTVEVMKSTLTYDPEKRESAHVLLRHPWFSTSPRAVEPEGLPTFPEVRNSSGKRRPLSSNPKGYIFDFQDQHEKKRKV